MHGGGAKIKAQSKSMSVVTSVLLRSLTLDDLQSENVCNVCTLAASKRGNKSGVKELLFMHVSKVPHTLHRLLLSQDGRKIWCFIAYELRVQNDILVRSKHSFLCYIWLSKMLLCLNNRFTIAVFCSGIFMNYF